MSDVTKIALKDPARWIRSLAPPAADPSVAAELTRRAESLAPLADELRRLESQLGRTSREIGAAKARSADTEPLITTMRDISARTHALEAELRGKLERIAADLRGLEPGGIDAAAEEMPAYFRVQWPAKGDSTGSTMVSTIDSDPDASDYARYVRAHPAATSYHELGLRELIEDTLDQRSHHLLARDEHGRVRGVLPLVRIRSRLFGDFVVSMPWFNYGGVLADSERVSEALMEAAAGFAYEAGCGHAEIRETHPRKGWISRTHKVSMTLALPHSVEALERSLGSSLRAQSNKAVRAGCTFRAGGAELLDEFYDVFSVNMRDLGTPVQSRAFYAAVLELFSDRAFIAVVSRGSRPLAAGFLLGHGTTLEIPWASSRRRDNSLGVNMLLYRRALGAAIEHGYRHFDFGRSSPGSATWRFKKQWGATQRQLHWHYWRRDGEQDSGGLSPDNPKYRLAIAAWQRMPVALTRLLGPSIVRGLP